MSSPPEAPLPLAGPPSPPSNPWTLFGLIGGTVAIAAGVLLLVVAAASQQYQDASPVPTVLGTALLGVGAVLLACALVLAGVGWYLRHPAPSRAPASAEPLEGVDEQR